MDKLDLASKLAELYPHKSAMTIIELILTKSKELFSRMICERITYKYNKDKELSAHYNGTVINNILYRPNEYKEKKVLMINGFLSYYDLNEIESLGKELK